MSEFKHELDVTLYLKSKEDLTNFLAFVDKSPGVVVKTDTEPLSHSWNANRLALLKLLSETLDAAALEELLKKNGFSADVFPAGEHEQIGECHGHMAAE